MAIINGNASNNLLTGTANADEVSGLGGNDTLQGAGGNDLLLGGLGNDSLVGGPGDDTLSGGGGNDVLVYQGTDTSVSGDSGIDTLRIEGSGVALNLTVTPNTVYQDLEVIDLTGTGNNSLTLARADVIAFSSTTNVLRANGNAGDVVDTTDGGWLRTLNVTIGSETYAQYMNGVAVLQVDASVTRSGIDTRVPVIQLSALNGANGFRLDGIDANDESGYSVGSAGDVNADGFEDVIIGAHFASPGGDAYAGESYVVFGKASGFASSINLAALNGTNGFVLNGIDVEDFSGVSVDSAGDVNGDGFDDLIIGAYFADPGGRIEAGESYVVFGKASGFAASVNLAALNGTNGFVLNGIDAGDYSGYSVASAGDVNGDGFDDLIIGGYYASPGGRTEAGESYVVFGKASGFAANVNLGALSGTTGFVINGINANDHSGWSVATAGDVNGDGFDDLIIGAFRADPSGINGAGENYVVFGKAGFASSIDLAAINGANGFRMGGIDIDDYTGSSAATAGDINGDGFGDLIIGASRADPGGDTSAGESYVVFGKASGFASSVNLATLNGTNGFRLDGIDAYDFSGVSVAAAGDVNGDGFDDLIVGAQAADPHGTSQAGETYVVFGKASGFASNINLAALNGTNGFRLEGIDVDDLSGGSVAAAGDVNGDGFDDLIIGAKEADPGGDSGAGESYVVFGADFTGVVTHLGTSGANSLTGTSAAQRFVSGQGNDTLTGGGGGDVFNAGAGNDLIRVASTTFRDVDGGSGTDTLAILGAGRTLDLIVLANNRISGIETIDLTGGGNNTLEIRKGDLLDLSDSTNRLTVNGNAGDTVNLVGPWNAGATVGGYDIYTQGAAKILIDIDMFVV